MNLPYHFLRAYQKFFVFQRPSNHDGLFTNIAQNPYRIALHNAPLRLFFGTQDQKKETFPDYGLKNMPYGSE